MYCSLLCVLVLCFHVCFCFSPVSPKRLTRTANYYLRLLAVLVPVLSDRVRVTDQPPPDDAAKLADVFMKHMVFHYRMYIHATNEDHNFYVLFPHRRRILSGKAW